jgi:hypothetical protein
MLIFGDRAALVRDDLPYILVQACHLILRRVRVYDEHHFVNSIRSQNASSSWMSSLITFE